MAVGKLPSDQERMVPGEYQGLAAGAACQGHSRGRGRLRSFGVYSSKGTHEQHDAGFGPCCCTFLPRPSQGATDSKKIMHTASNGKTSWEVTELCGRKRVSKKGQNPSAVVEDPTVSLRMALEHPTVPRQKQARQPVLPAQGRQSWSWHAANYTTYTVGTDSNTAPDNIGQTVPHTHV